MDVLGIFSGLFKDCVTIHRGLEEFRFDECYGSAVPRLGIPSGDRVLLLSIAVLCLHGKVLPLVCWQLP